MQQPLICARISCLNKIRLARVAMLITHSIPLGIARDTKLHLDCCLLLRQHYSN